VLAEILNTHHHIPVAPWSFEELTTQVNTPAIEQALDLKRLQLRRLGIEISVDTPTQAAGTTHAIHITEQPIPPELREQQMCSALLAKVASTLMHGADDGLPVSRARDNTGSAIMHTLVDGAVGISPILTGTTVQGSDSRHWHTVTDPTMQDQLQQLTITPDVPPMLGSLLLCGG
jgi:hypothetical protein